MSVAVRPAAVDASPTFPRRGGWATTTLVALASGLLASVVALWFVHDGVADLGDGWVAASRSFTRITGLLASVAGLVGLGLLTRPRNLERSVGLDTIFIWHRRLGATTAILVGAHVAGAIVNASATVGPINALLDLTGREAYMATATVGAILIGVVTVSSIASVRRRLSYETWYFVHLTAYLGLALAFSHQIFVGTDLADGAWTSAAWIAVNLGVVAAVVWGRWGRLVAAAARSLRVTAVDAVGPDTTTLWLSGPRAGERAEPGQFYLLRPLRPRLWWHAHPYSLSARPTSNALRFTIKQRGDASRAIAALPVGSRVVAEGPYGHVTPHALGSRRVVFVVGGVGIAPVLALVESLELGSEPLVLWRARHEADLVHREELERAVDARGGRVAILLGPTALLATGDPFSATSLRSVDAQIHERVAVLCGPERLIHAARRGLLAAGMPTGRIHFERPWW